MIFPLSILGRGPHDFLYILHGFMDILAKKLERTSVDAVEVITDGKFSIIIGSDVRTTYDFDFSDSPKR